MAKVRRGPVQRLIWRAFVGQPGAELSTSELVAIAYPRLRNFRKSHGSAVRRAALAVARPVRRIRPGGIVWVKR